jgi:hypothetical protein
MIDALKSIRIEGLSHADMLELRDFQSQRKSPQSDITIGEVTLPPHKLGEPVTFFVIASLTAAGIGVVGAWLLKKRTKTDILYTSTVVDSDGTTRVETLSMSRSESDPPSPEFMEKLSSLTKLPVSGLEKLMTETDDGEEG